MQGLPLQARGKGTFVRRLEGRWVTPLGIRRGALLAEGAGCARCCSCSMPVLFKKLQGSWRRGEAVKVVTWAGRNRSPRPPSHDEPSEMGMHLGTCDGPDFHLKSGFFWLLPRRDRRGSGWKGGG